eukprot:378823-Prorocentrum_minimum.AAC.1
MRDETGAASSMCARGAQWNASIFSTEGLRPVPEVSLGLHGDVQPLQTQNRPDVFHLRPQLGGAPRHLTSASRLSAFRVPNIP